MVITCGIAIVELAVNMAVTGLGCTGRSSYNANVDDMQKALKLAKEDAADTMYHFTGLRIQADLLKMMAHDTAMLLEHSFLP